jgi:hypothetical protein
MLRVVAAMPTKKPAEITAQLSSPAAVRSVENQRNSPPICWLQVLCESSGRGDGICTRGR